MAYTYGQSAIKKNNYDVYIRVHVGADAPWATGPASLDGFIRSSVLNETVRVVYKDDLSTNLFNHWDGTTGDQCWVKIGKGNEKPTAKNSAGQSLNLNTGDELTISENTEVMFEDLQVTSANYTELRQMAAYGNVDVLFVETPLVGAATVDNGIGISNVKLSAYLEVTGNDFNKIVVSAKKESSIDTDVIQIISVTT